MESVTTPYFKVTQCEVCGSSLPPPALDLGLQPLCDDLVAIGETRQATKYPTELSLCPHCLTAHHVFAVRKELLFPADYHYRARLTGDVLSGMSDLVSECERIAGPLKGKVVCDIGCNDGSLLSRFRERDAKTVGIEPTAAAEEASQAGHFIVRDYLSPEAVGLILSHAGRPDIITFTNVFAHIESLRDAIESLRELVQPNCLLVIENHYLGSIVRGRQFDTFYHEHPRTYSARSFKIIASRLGGNLIHVSFPRRYGGNIRVFISRFGQGDRGMGELAEETPAGIDETSLLSEFTALQSFFDHWRRRTLTEIESLHGIHQHLAGKSFPGRASILINALSVDATVIPWVYEKPASPKIGHYVPGTRIEIRSDAEWQAPSTPPDAMIIWAWHIVDEVADYIRSKGFRGKLYTPLPEMRCLK